MMTLKEIKKAVNQGKQVRWVSDIYHVKKVDDYFIIHCIVNDNVIGLTWLDNKTLNGYENDFYIKGGL